MSHSHFDYQSLLRERGYRVTLQRQLILDTLCESGCHSSPEMIFDRVQVKAPAIHRATVYRSLDFLCEMRLVVAIQLGRQMYYEIASATPHHHLVCRKCDQVEQIGPAEVKPLFSRIERKHHFTVDMDHLTLFGLCQKCRRVLPEK